MGQVVLSSAQSLAMMLGALGGVVAVSMLLVRDARYCAGITLLYLLIAVALSFTLPIPFL